MGDRYVVTKTLREGKAWYYSYVCKANNESRICCQGTPSLFTANAYFQDVQEAQQNTLKGLNPFVTAHYAHSYIVLNRMNRK